MGDSKILAQLKGEKIPDLEGRIAGFNPLNLPVVGPEVHSGLSHMNPAILNPASTKDGASEISQIQDNERLNDALVQLRKYGRNISEVRSYRTSRTYRGVYNLLQIVGLKPKIGDEYDLFSKTADVVKGMTEEVGRVIKAYERIVARHWPKLKELEEKIKQDSQNADSYQASLSEKEGEVDRLIEEQQVATDDYQEAHSRASLYRAVSGVLQATGETALSHLRSKRRLYSLSVKTTLMANIELNLLKGKLVKERVAMLREFLDENIELMKLSSLSESMNLLSAGLTEITDFTSDIAAIYSMDAQQLQKVYGGTKDIEALKEVYQVAQAISGQSYAAIVSSTQGLLPSKS